MLRLYEKLTMLAATSLSLLTSLALSSPVVGPEPIRCAPCTQEKLDECPAISPDCKQVLREPGCGCCLACALEKGASCGVYTAHCAPGLKCSPRPGDPRPLHSLTRGQAICTEDQGQVEGVPDHSYLTYLLGLNTPFDTKDEGAQESIEAKVNTIRKKLVEQGPCHIELHAALDKITSSQQELGEKFTTFYLPNCDKHGFYKAKQCESSLVGPPAMCWCVLLEWVEDYGVQLSTRRLRVPAGAHSLNHGHSDPHSQAHACTRIDTYTEYFFTQLKHT